MKLTAPGLYSDVPEAAYHGDLCPGPSLSASGCIDLVWEDGCPAKFFENSYLNPNRAPEEFSNEKAMGTATHVAVLEPDLWNKKVVVLEYESYQKKAAQAERDDALASGRTPITLPQADKIQGMLRALRSHGVARDAFTEGKGEQTIVWKDDIWFKVRIDWLKNHRRFAIDYKTCPSAHPSKFVTHAYSMGYLIQGALQCYALSTINDDKISLEYYYVAQERNPPYCCAVYKLTPDALEWGLRFVVKAKQMFMACLERNEWPMYREHEYPYQDRAFDLGLPHYAPFRLQEMDEKGAFKPLPKPDDALLKRAFEFQSPDKEIV